MNAGDQIICISTTKMRPCLSLQRTSTMLFFFNGVSGASSAGRYSTSSMNSSGPRNGSSALSRLITKSGCSPNTFLKVRSALGSRYLIFLVCFRARFAVTCPIPIRSRQTKQVCKVSVSVYLSYKIIPFHRKVKKKSRKNEFLASFSKQMNRIDKYCIAFSCFFINFFTPLEKRLCVRIQTQVRFT